MSVNDLNLMEMIRSAEREGANQITAEECRISNTVAATTATVYVTLPNSEAPQQRVLADHWCLQVGWSGSALVPRWPTRGEDGLLIYTDTGEAWLIY